ncbi:MAG: autorepressor SdpR family transcription factor [Eubacterium sp.]|nr:autorepressor SdpR family transcription factor [Eubacterium sp.]
MGMQETLKALSDPVRREILELLKDGRLPAGEIAKHFTLSAATVSHHLSQLKKAGLLVETKYKNFVFYEINVTVFEEVILWISRLMGGNEDESKS